jgi:hypothetical protein
MRVKLVYSAPVSVNDSLDEPIRDPQVLATLDGISCVPETVLEYLDELSPDQADFHGGYLRLVLDKKKLKAVIELDAPRKLSKSELAALRDDLDGQVSDGIGEGGFDFVSEAADLTIRTFPELGGNSALTQTSGEAWRPKSVSAENAANNKRCKAAAAAVKAGERAAKAPKKRAPKGNQKKLMKLIQKGFGYPRPAGIEQEVAAEIANLCGDLSSLPLGSLPYERLANVKLLRLLLDAKLNPNSHDREGHSLLWLAVGSPACVALLLDRGADVNLRNTEVYRDTALMDAARLAELKTVQLLLARGADPLLKDRFGRTALDEAQENDDSRNAPATVRVLKAAMKK